MEKTELTEVEWERLYHDYSGKVLGYILARVQRRADAEDLCAEVFEKAWRRYEAFDPEKASISTWIFTITRNTVIDFFRKNHPSEELDENMAEEGEVDDELLNGETLEELAKALTTLPAEQQDIIVMLYYDRKPMTEIAKLMRLSYGAVKIRHQKALSALRKQLEG